MDRELPHAVESENAFLGAIMKDPSAIPLALSMVKPADLYVSANRTIYEACLSLHEEHGSLDAHAVYQCLDSAGKLEGVGGGARLFGLSDGVSSANLELHGSTIRDSARLRAVLAACLESVEAIYESNGGADTTLESVSSMISGALTDAWSERGRALTAKDIVVAAMARMEKMGEDGAKGPALDYGFPDLDVLTGGLWPGHLVVLAGRPSMGKTSFCLNLLRNVSVLGREPALLFSLESSSTEVANALLSAHGRVCNTRMRDGMLSGDEWDRLADASNWISGAPLYIVDAPRLGLLDIQARAKLIHARSPLSLIALDYLQLVRVPSKKRQERRDLEVGEITAGLKAIAKELEVPVVALSQLNRSVESREGHRPRLSDLRESGSIEQDADMVIFLHRPGRYQKTDEDRESRRAEAIVAKNRHGPIGSVHLTFMYEHYRFESAKRGEPDQS